MKDIPESRQDLSTEEIVEQDYNVVQQSEQHSGRSRDERVPDQQPNLGSLQQPGRTRYDDSVEASSDDPGGDSEGHEYSAGYESPMATRIGDEENPEEGERLRELHEGRHRSDGEHSYRESQRDKKRIAQAITSDLPVTDRERKEVVHIVEQLNLDRFGNQKAIERVVLGAVVVVVDEWHRQEQDEVEELVQWCDKFRDICDQKDVSMSDLTTIKAKVRESAEEGRISVGPDRPRRDPALPDPAGIERDSVVFWKNVSPEKFANMAEHWDAVPQDWKDAMPDICRERIRLLRLWEPWHDEAENE